MTSRLALGFSVHTGWAAALVAGGNARHPRIEAREIVELLDDRARFVYHRAAEQSPAKAKRDLEEARREAIARAQEGIARLGHERRLACVAIVARQDGDIVGVAAGWTQGGVAHLSDLMVAAGLRSQGIGSKLLAAFESLAAERGCRRLSLRTYRDQPAYEFYKGHGWVDEARWNWKHGREFVQMRRDL